MRCEICLAGTVIGSVELDLPAEPDTVQVAMLTAAPAFARWRALFDEYQDALRKVPQGGTVPPGEWNARRAAVEATQAFVALSPTGEVVGRVTGMNDLSYSETEQAYTVEVTMHPPFVPPSA